MPAKSARHSHSQPSLTVDEALTRLQSSSYRLTRPRRALLDAILKFAKPFSVPDLEKRLKGKNGCDPVTIYRTLPIFAELGLLEKCDFSDEMTYYEVRHGLEGHHHHHVVCTKCSKVEPLEFCLVDGQEQQLKRLGYKNLKHRLEFSGICPTCS